MAALSSGDIDIIWARVMTEWSRRRLPMGSFNKHEFRQTIVDIDSGLNNSEGAILNGISNATARTWLLANQSIGREIMVDIMSKRQEVL